MKKNFLITFILGLVFTTLSLGVQGQPPPPPPENPAGGGNGPVGGGAPIGSGLIMLVGLGLAYGATKVISKSSEAE